MSKGCLISFEGLDGAGKTTQIALLARWLETRDISFVLTREPGGTPLGNEIRHILFNRSDLMISPLAEAFLFQADRAQHFATMIFPALDEGKLVITDRCYDSSIAYQGAARGVGVVLVEHLSRLATHDRSPDLTILLDLDPTQVQTRTSKDRDSLREEQSRFDKEEEQFHDHLRQAFLELAHTHPERIKIIDASQHPERIHQQIVGLVEQLLSSMN